MGKNAYTLDIDRGDAMRPRYVGHNLLDELKITLARAKLTISTR